MLIQSHNLSLSGFTLYEAERRKQAEPAPLCFLQLLKKEVKRTIVCLLLTHCTILTNCFTVTIGHIRDSLVTLVDHNPDGEVAALPISSNKRLIQRRICLTLLLHFGFVLASRRQDSLWKSRTGS